MRAQMRRQAHAAAPVEPSWIAYLLLLLNAFVAASRTVWFREGDSVSLPWNICTVWFREGDSVSLPWNILTSASLARRTTECVMDWNRLEGNWKQFKGRAKEKWGRLTDDDLDVINGRQDQLEGKLQERYGLAKDQAKKDVEAWFRSLP
jgi:uncharacterized protein YjbJ (UPF0337 family)